MSGTLVLKTMGNPFIYKHHDRNNDIKNKYVITQSNTVYGICSVIEYY